MAQKCVQKYNDTVHSVTKYAPSYLMYGKEATMLPSEMRKDILENDLMLNRKKALENSGKSHDYNKRIYDKNRKLLDFNVGDMVFVENGSKLNRRKLDELRVRPYEIVRKISNSIYEIDTGHRKTESNLFHISKLTPANKKKT